MDELAEDGRAQQSADPKFEKYRNEPRFLARVQLDRRLRARLGPSDLALPEGDRRDGGRRRRNLWRTGATAGCENRSAGNIKERRTTATLTGRTVCWLR
jgi:hypothetical protein